MTTIIIKNLTGSPLPLTTLGVSGHQIQASGQAILTEGNTIGEIQDSNELKSHIENGNAILNINGQDRTTSESLSALYSSVILSSGIAPVHFNAYLTKSQDAFSDETTVLLNQIRLQNQTPNFTLSNSEVAVETSAGPGVYRINYDVNADNGGKKKTKAHWWLELDTGGGFSEVAGTRRSTYHQNSSYGEDSASATIHLQLNVGYKLRIRGDSISGNSVEPLANGVSLTIEKVGE